MDRLSKQVGIVVDLVDLVLKPDWAFVFDQEALVVLRVILNVDGLVLLPFAVLALAAQ